MKHTPGPWEYLTETIYMGDYPAGTAHRIKIGSETLTICSHAEGWVGGKRVEVDAKLMAAAPELLEACKEALEELENTVGAETLGALLCRQAIAKATGEDGVEE